MENVDQKTELETKSNPSSKEPQIVVITQSDKEYTHGDVCFTLLAGAIMGFTYCYYGIKKGRW